MKDSVERYKAAIESFAHRQLDRYIQHIRSFPHPSNELKEINDAVWQTISLYSFEVTILDSPLLQRLRQVSQLGVAHWTYPSAGHTRLEHSIGTVHQVQRVLNSFETHRTGGATIPEDMKNLVRLAALCHDVGHGFMSHVVENALDAMGAIEQLLLDLAAEFEKESCQLGEAAAYFILGSDAFRALLNEARHAYPQHQLPMDCAERLQSAILGKVIHSRYPLLQELISGPFDADKLDYMPRDAMMAGIPIVTDIPRLVQKIRLVEIAKDSLPTEVAAQVEKNDDASYYIQAVMLSGARTLDELMLGRTLLFDKVYRHQKVRSAEAMIAKIVAALIPLVPGREASLPLALSDGEVLAFQRETLKVRLDVNISDADWEELAPIRDICERIKVRNLFVRAYAFATTMPGDPFREDPVQRVGLDDLERKVRQPAARAQVLEAIVDAIKTMRPLVPGEIAPQIDDAHLHHYVALDPPSPQNRTSEISRAYLVSGKNTILKFRDDSGESSPWSNAYLMTRDIGFVFAAEELAVATFLACELVVRTTFNVRTPASAALYAKTHRPKIDSLRRKLTDKRFYDERAPDLRSTPPRLQRGDVDQRITTIVGRMSGYEGASAGAGSFSAVRITKERVLAWLCQFRTDEEIEGGLSLLEAVKVLSRRDVVDGLDSFFTSNSSFREGSICPFGSPKDSSSILTYFAQDLAGKHPLTVEAFEVALSKAGASITFVDDFVASGQQSASILLKWMGQKPLLDEDHGPALAEGARSELKKRKLAFVFISGQSSGAELLRTTARNLELDATVEFIVPDERLPKAFDPTSSFMRDDFKRNVFRERCKEIGRQLLANYGKARTPEWIEGKELGYGGAAYLLVFPYNTPTQTLTLLWCSGQVDGVEWLPLVPRRPKK